jgi:hypothetical protein
VTITLTTAFVERRLGIFTEDNAGMSVNICSITVFLEK